MILKMINKLFILLVVTASFVACKNEKKVESKVTDDVVGVYEAVFIDVNNTIIPDDIDPNVLIERKQLGNLNLTETDHFWHGKTNYFVHAMGSLSVQESGKYYFRLTGNGKLMFRMNNNTLFDFKKNDKKDVQVASLDLDAGFKTFEFQYFPGSMTPYILVEWSRDGENFEVIPDELFGDLDRIIAKPWINDEITPEVKKQEDNTLSEAEKKEGWRLLFDGKTTNGWHTYLKPGHIGKKWVAKDGALVFEGRDRFIYFVADKKMEWGPTDKVKDGGEDIVSDEAFENFELEMEWKISKGGNNGIFYTIKENEDYDEVWKTSPEMQVMDNVGHKDGLIYTHRAGDLYDLIAADPVRVKPYDTWNKVRIVKIDGKIEQWLNGTKVVSYDTNSSEWTEMVSKSKFAEYKDFASPGPGRIGFQDHDNLVYYKNIKIKEL